MSSSVAAVLNLIIQCYHEPPSPYILRPYTLVANTRMRTVMYKDGQTASIKPALINALLVSTVVKTPISPPPHSKTKG